MVSIGIDDVVWLSDLPYFVGIVGVVGQFFDPLLHVFVEHGEGVDFHPLSQDFLALVLL